MKKRIRYFSFLFVTLILGHAQNGYTQNVNKYIKCYALKDNFVIEKRTKLVIPIRFTNPQKLRIDLGAYIPESNNKGGNCIPSKFEVLFKKTPRAKYRTYLFDSRDTKLTDDPLYFISREKILDVCIPELLYEEGYYKFKFILYYLIGKSKKIHLATTQWINIKVL